MALIHKILVATDFSESANHAIDHGAELALKFSAPILLVHVYALPLLAVPDGFVPLNVPDVATAMSQLHDGLNKARDRARTRGAVEIETRLVEGVPWHEIIETAKAQGCDLIVMGTQGRSGVAHFLVGSVAEKVVRKAECPVLTVHRPR